MLCQSVWEQVDTARGRLYIRERGSDSLPTDVIMLTVILLTILLAALLVYPYFLKRSRLPPGPFPFPIIGNIPQIAKLSAVHGGIVGAMRELKKEYGPVFTLWMGILPTVHIASIEIAQETMVKRGGEFTDRWVPHLFHAVRKGLGIIGTNGDRWLEQRRFALHTLRNFGLGRSIVEDRIMAEIDARTATIDKEIGNKTVEMEPHHLFDIMVGNIINRMLFSVPLDEPDSSEFYQLKAEIEKFAENISILDFILNNEFLNKLPFFSKRYATLIEPQKKLKAFLSKQVAQRISEIDSGEHSIAEEPEDYVDAFLIKIKQEQKEGGPTTYDTESLVFNLFDLWIAGQETTVTTTVAGFAYLLNNTSVIDQIRKELLSVTQGERSLSLKDRPNTPYYNAAIMEIQRVASILNLNLFRRTKEPTEVGGYPVDAGVPLTAQISLILSDEKYFDSKFDPTRFLRDESLDQHVIPFGLGKRSCLGESLARAELYLIIGNMILRYDIQPTEELPKTEQKNNVGVFKRPAPYKMQIKKIF